MKQRRYWMILGGILSLAAAFLLLDFRAAISNTQAEKNASTASIGGELPAPMQRWDKISIFVDGEGSLAGALREALAAEMDEGWGGETELVERLQTVHPNPVLIVKMGKPGLLWTPLYSASRFTVQAGYASNGETRLFDKTPVTFDNKNGAALQMHAEYTLSDRSWGLISRPGYHRLLAEALAQHIVAALKELYKTK